MGHLMNLKPGSYSDLHLKAKFETDKVLKILVMWKRCFSAFFVFLTFFPIKIVNSFLFLQWILH